MQMRRWLRRGAWPSREFWLGPSEVSFAQWATQLYERSPWARDSPTSEVVAYRSDEATPATRPAVLCTATDDAFADPTGGCAMGRRKPWHNPTRPRRDLRYQSLQQHDGPSESSFWSAVPMEPALRCTSAQRVAALRSRLGLSACFGVDERCQLTMRDGEQCQALVDPQLRHPTWCGKGPTNLRTHTALYTILRQEFDWAGASIDLEYVVPEYYSVDSDGRIHEARIDLVVSFLGSPVTERIDVAVRIPFCCAF